MALRRRIIRRRRGPRRRFVRARRRLNRRTGGLLQYGMNRRAFVSDPKFYDNAYGFGSDNGLWAIAVLNYGVAQGTAATNRVGNKIYMKKINVRLNWTSQNQDGSVSYWALNNGTSNVQIRVMVVYDRQNNGTTASKTDIYATGASLEIQQFNNMDNKDRFTTLMDKKFTLSQGLAPGLNLDFNLPVKRVTQYITNNTTGNASDMKTGALLLCCCVQYWGNSVGVPSVGGQGGWWRLNSRMRYLDQ